MKLRAADRVSAADLPPWKPRTLPLDYRPSLTRTWATPSYLRHVPTPPEPPQVPARPATAAETPAVARRVATKLQDVGWLTRTTYAVSHDGKASVTVLARRGHQAAMTSWQTTTTEDGTVKGAMRMTSHLWPHGVGTSLHGATAWAHAVGISTPKPEKR